jgi:cysteine desulfurase
MQTIYLDNNATTLILPEVAQAMAECFAAGYANPASQHAPGRRARAVLEDAREGIGRLLGADLSGVNADRVVFTSGGAEANNLAVRGLAQANSAAAAGRLVISAIEHPSVVGPAEHLAAQGWRLDRLGVDAEGVAEIDDLVLDEETRLVSIMLGNNETGVLQPVAEAAARCRATGVLCHTDAVQAVGKAPVDFRALGVDALSCAAHKFHGPRGIGVLIVRHDAPLGPILYGGFQQAGLRPGTESVALAVGMHRALQIWDEEQPARTARMTALRDRLEAALGEGWPEAVINGRQAARLPHTSSVAFPGLDRQALAMALDQAGVACSTGSACASGSSEPSPVLLAMGCPEAVVEGSLRLSLGALTTVEEVDDAARRILRVCNMLRGEKSPGISPSTPPAGTSKGV